jgi:hypothetical protein
VSDHLADVRFLAGVDETNFAPRDISFYVVVLAWVLRAARNG